MRFPISCVVTAALIFALPAEAAWKKEQRKSELTDITDAVWSTPSTNQIPDIVGIHRRAYLMVVCQQGTPRILFNFNNFFAENPFMIRFRVDKGKIVEQLARTSPNGTHFGWDNDEARGFVDQIRDGKRLVVVASPYQTARREVSFNLNGFKAVLAEAKRICDW